MLKSERRAAWLQSGLFWRTFLLLSILVMSSMASWVLSFKLIEHKPRAIQLSNQIVSIVAITRAALTHSAHDKRIQLLTDLVQHEGIQIYPLENDDKIKPASSNGFQNELQTLIRLKLGQRTRFAQFVNEEEGFWLSFQIEDDEYWLRLEADRLQSETSLQLIAWLGITLCITLIVAAFISRRINAPLARLSAVAQKLANGQQPSPLIETGPTEIQQTYARFNQMMNDLARIDADRAMILAGISHDLRTPLTRLQLELEMAPLDQATREAMQADLKQMDHIIQQFLDYAKPLNESDMSSVDLGALIQAAIKTYTRDPSIQIDLQIIAPTAVRGAEIELKRVITNLLQNADRYGRDPNTKQLKLAIHCHASDDQKTVCLRIRDHGIGVTNEDIPQLLRPFTRANTARSQALGAGLGLAIVDRIVSRHGGNLQISSPDGGGFLIEVRLTSI